MYARCFIKFEEGLLCQSEFLQMVVNLYNEIIYISEIYTTGMVRNRLIYCSSRERMEYQ